MVIFHGYVKSPDGRYFVPWRPPLCSGIFDFPWLITRVYFLHPELWPFLTKHVASRYASENSLRIIPIKLGHRYPPEPPDVHGRKQNAEIFKRILYIDGKKMEERDVAVTCLNSHWCFCCHVFRKISLWIQRVTVMMTWFSKGESP